MKVSGFDQVTSFQFTLGWNARLIQFEGLMQGDLADLQSSHFNLSNAGNGRLVCSWDDVTGKGQSLGEGAVLMRLKFRALDTPAAVSPVRFLRSPAAPEITVQSVVSDTKLQEGSVWIGTGPEDVRLLLPSLRLGTEAEGGGGSIVLSVPTVKGMAYLLESSDSLSEPFWRSLKGFSGDGGRLVIADLAPVSGQRFYRLRTALELGSDPSVDSFLNSR